MAYGTTSNSGTVNTAANLRNMVSLFETVMLAGGWVQTADTGQTAAASFPGATTNAPVGYQIWRMNDSFQATKPVYVKFEFGGGTVLNSFGTWLTVGTGSDGSGNITGVLLSRTAYQSAGANTATYSSFGSADSNRCSFIWLASYSTANMIVLWGIERSKDGAGMDTGDGIIVMGATTGYNGGGVSTQYVPFIGTARPAQGALCVPIPYGSASLASGTDFGVVPILPFGATGAVNPGMNFVVYNTTDTAPLNRLPIDFLGTPHYYYTLGQPFGWTSGIVVEMLSSALAMRYE